MKSIKNLILDKTSLARFALLAISVVLFVFMSVLLPENPGVYLIFLYSALVLLLALLALFGKFPDRGTIRLGKKIRKDIEIPDPQTDDDSSRDYRKDLAEQENLVKFLFESSADGLWNFDFATGKVEWSDRAAEVCGLDENFGKSFDVLKSAMLENSREEFLKELPKAIEENREFRMEVHIWDHVGKQRVILLYGKPQQNAEGRAIRMIGHVVDVTEERRAQRNLVYSALYDTLTGVKNRRFFLDRAGDEISRSRQRPDYLFAVIFIDIARFTALNDSYSHGTGDKLLRVLADRLSAVARENDVVARLGGDEFGILVRNLEGRDADGFVRNLVRHIQNEIRLPITVDGREISLSAAIAVVFNRDFESVESLLASADTMLKKAKQEGSDSVQFFVSGMREKALGLYKLEMEIRKAIQNDEFLLMFQPIVDIQHGNRVSGFEALVRWNNSERGIVSPAEFIPMAEETGLIVPMGERILRMACVQMKKWVDLGYGDMTCAVNFSAQQFALDNMVQEVERILQETGLPPKNLKLEVTEYTAMTDMEKTIGIMRKLADMGISISIDDFGTGYSSLSYLKRYPIRTLKIDRSFVMGVPAKAEDVAIIRMVIGMAKTLGLDLIAEGAETRDQVDFLKREGCNYIQGFYFSKPLLPDAALGMMEKSRAVEKSPRL